MIRYFFLKNLEIAHWHIFLAKKTALCEFCMDHKAYCATSILIVLIVAASALRIHFPIRM
jgi:hypothetical protein